jgi:DNA-binding PadR family transcriptional regulator
MHEFMDIGRRLEDTEFFILAALAERPMYGEAILADVDRVTAGRVHLQMQPLFAALEQLRADGLIELSGEDQSGSRRRCYYRLTADGAGLLAEEANHLHNSAAIVFRRLNRASARKTGTRRF